VYAWVLILPGRREVAEPFFIGNASRWALTRNFIQRGIDAPTGKQFSTEDVNFVGVESVWSTKNYWVNMQPCFEGLKVSWCQLW
jgi:hypothetical protein